MKLTIPAEPYDFEAELESTALLIIDFQRDFIEPGGFGEQLGNNVSLLRQAIPAAKKILETARCIGMSVVHTREGHLPNLSDCPPSKRDRGRLKLHIGDKGPMGRILVRGEAGHAIIPELTPIKDEIVVDKPGKGAFYATDLDRILREHGIKSLIVCGVTTEVCVHSTVREANDRGYECLLVSDAVASYFPEFQKVALDMIKSQRGIFGWVAPSSTVLTVLESIRESLI